MEKGAALEETDGLQEFGDLVDALVLPILDELGNTYSALGKDVLDWDHKNHRRETGQGGPSKQPVKGLR